MERYHRIALKTEEDSIKQIHEKILKLLENQSVEAKALIQQLIDYYQKIILCMPGNVYWMDKSCHTIGCNQKVLDMFGLQKLSDFENLSFEEMSEIGSWTKEQGDSFKKDTLDVINTAQPKMNIEEPPIPDAKGNLLYFLSSRMPLFNSSGDVIGVVGISTDITQQKLTEQALKKANKAKTEFLANLSHDLRTPLASIVSLTEHLNNKLSDKPLKDLAYDAQSCAEQVLLLIDEILEITEIDLGRAQNDVLNFNLNNLVSSICQLMHSPAKQKGLSLTFTIDENIPQVLRGKRQLLHRVLLNLVGNSIKFTPKGHVKITASLVNQISSDVEIVINVIDSGIGIPLSMKEKIFDQFERLSASYENEYEGRGLGLYIVKEFLKLMDGRIEVESIENQGSKFSIFLPLKTANEIKGNQVMENQNVKYGKINSLATIKNESLEKPQIKEDTTHSIKVLLVEDLEIARKAASMTLSSLNCGVDLAENGKKAIQLATQNDYQMILLDIGLPDISGIEVAKKIREMELVVNKLPVPIVALTAHIAQSSVQHCINAGIQQVIRKPLTVQRADSLFRNWLDELYQPPQKTEAKAATKNEDFYKQFIEDLRNNKLNVISAFENNERKELRDAVHRIHGAARFLDITPLIKSCNSLESAIIDEFSDEEIAEFYQELLENIETTLEDNPVSKMN